MILLLNAALYREVGQRYAGGKGNVMDQQSVVAVTNAVKNIDEIHFAALPDGWPDQIGIALVDAVYSIQADYLAKDPTKGVLNRVRAFRSAYPEAANDLERLCSLGEQAIREVMGNGKSAGRYKSVCVVEAAENFLALDPPVKNASHLHALNPDHKRAYTAVKGLGWVTYEYLTMLLGQPGIKADTMICRFVDTALTEAGLAPVDAHAARRLVEAVQVAAYPHIELHHFDHAIWLHQRAVSSRGDSQQETR